MLASLSRIRLLYVVVAFIIGISALAITSTMNASASSPYYTGVAQATIGSQTWSVYGYVYYANNSSSSVTLIETSEWVRLDYSDVSSVDTAFRHKVIEGNDATESSYLEYHAMSQGQSRNERWTYPLPWGGGSKTYYKTGGGPVRSDINSWMNSNMSLGHIVYFWPSFTCHYTTAGLVTLLVDTSTC